jgi:hypothetical protein
VLRVGLADGEDGDIDVVLLDKGVLVLRVGDGDLADLGPDELLADLEGAEQTEDRSARS